jgi:uncharacterized membrane protein
VGASWERTRSEIATRLGGDRALLASAALAGLGLGGLLHGLLVAMLERWDRLAVLPGASGAGLRHDLLSVGAWVAIAVGVMVYAATRRGAAGPGARRALGVAVAVAGVVVLVVGELEVHVFDTLAQRWAPHDLAWDVLFHVPGEAIAFAGWLLLPGAPRATGQTSSGTRSSSSTVR